MPTEDFENATIYKSATIMDRRRRILQATREMIAELGYDGVSVRELTARAGVAQRTLYNAFGSKENIVATAIAEYQKDFDDKAGYLNPPSTLRGRMEQLVKIHSRNLQIRPYTTATLAIYNSLSVDPTIRLRMRKITHDHIWPFAQALAADRQLVDQISPDDFAERAISFGYATLTEWVRRTIPDENLVARMVETLLTTVIVCTRPEGVNIEAQRWLAALRDRAPEWEEFRRQAERDGAARTTRRAAADKPATGKSRKRGAVST
jgi:AcrR family transcriptional regulator